MFCPTELSSRQLNDDFWMRTLTDKMQQLFRLLGECEKKLVQMLCLTSQHVVKDNNVTAQMHSTMTHQLPYTFSL